MTFPHKTISDVEMFCGEKLLIDKNKKTAQVMVDSAAGQGLCIDPVLQFPPVDILIYACTDLAVGLKVSC